MKESPNFVLHFKISANFYGIMRGSEEKQKIFERELAFLEKALSKKKFFAGRTLQLFCCKSCSIITCLKCYISDVAR